MGLSSGEVFIVGAAGGLILALLWSLLEWMGKR